MRGLTKRRRTIRPGQRSRRRRKPKIKPYDKVITKDAKTSAGLVPGPPGRRQGLFRDPDRRAGQGDALGDAAPADAGGLQLRRRAGRGTGSCAGNSARMTCCSRDVKYEIRAEVNDPIKDAVQATSLEAIIAVFPVQAYGKDKRPVIDVTSVFKSDLPEFSAKGRLRASGIDAQPHVHRQGEVVSDEHRGEGDRDLPAAGAWRSGLPAGPARRRGRRRRRDGHAAPQHDRAARAADEAPALTMTASVSSVSRSRTTAARSKKSTGSRTSPAGGSRRRSPKAAVSEPKKPIVFYIGREVPAKWRPWVKKGIEAWQPAFEKAGFKNAIIAKEPPSQREDPDWDAEDARYSSIRWLPSTIENAYGPHVHDPRTGEILESDIRMYHNVLKLVSRLVFRTGLAQRPEGAGAAVCPMT